MVLWHITFIVMGTLALFEDSALRSEKCGQESHIFKFAIFNVVFAFFSVVTFFAFPGGGEGARARAVLLTIVHLGLFVWAFLMWTRQSATCAEDMATKYVSLHLFYCVSTVHNLVFGTLLIFHEVFLGEFLGLDLTLVCEMRSTSPMKGSFPQAIPQGPVFHQPPQEGATNSASLLPISASDPGPLLPESSATTGLMVSSPPPQENVDFKTGIGTP